MVFAVIAMVHAKNALAAATRTEIGTAVTGGVVVAEIVEGEMTEIVGEVRLVGAVGEGGDGPAAVAAVPERSMVAKTSVLSGKCVFYTLCPCIKVRKPLLTQCLSVKILL